jgi:hypothetical protein
MDATTLFRMAYEQGVKLALDDAGMRVERPGVPVERPLHHDVKDGQPARFGAKGREYAQKRADVEPDYVAKARDYADRYHKSLLARFKAEHEAKSKPPEPKVADHDVCEHGLESCEECCEHGKMHCEHDHT